MSAIEPTQPSKPPMVLRVSGYGWGIFILIVVAAAIAASRYVEASWMRNGIQILGAVLAVILMTVRPYFCRSWRNPSLGDFLRCWWMTLAGFVVALIPLWVILYTQYALNAQGFWEKFVVLGLGVYLLGAIQVGCLVFYGIFVADVWKDPRKNY